MRRCNRTWFLLLFLGGGGGWGGGDKNVIHTACMPNTLVFTAFSPLCTTYCTRMWTKKICRKRPASRDHAQHTSHKNRQSPEIWQMHFRKCKPQKIWLQRLSWQECMETSQITVFSAPAHSTAVRLASRLHTQQRKSPRALKAPTTKRPENLAKTQRFAKTNSEITPF